jgi:hypothetical protein
MRSFFFVAVVALALTAGLSADDAEKPVAEQAASSRSRERENAKTTQKKSAPPKQQLFTGKVVLLREALERRGISAYDEFEKQVVLETADNELIPIIPDWRGRAFFQDKRLRDRKVDLVGYRRRGVPYLQILMVFTYNKQGQRRYTDYWCDICAIPMYEIQPCDCCQGPIQLRFQTRDLPDYLTDQQVPKRAFVKDRKGNRIEGLRE